MRGGDKSQRLKACFAQAQFANDSEYPAELAFKRGDILKILSRNPEIEGVSDGWWLCVDRYGRKGVAPGNRLKIMEDQEDHTGKNFFEVANTLFNDFSMFVPRRDDDLPFSDDFFRGPRMFPSTFRDRFDNLRRVNSCESAFGPSSTTVVRNIPIKIISQEPRVISTEPMLQRRFSDFPREEELPRHNLDVSTNRVCPPPIHQKRVSDGGQDGGEDEQGEEDERYDGTLEPQPRRTLVIPTGDPRRSLEIPIGQATPTNQKQMEKLTRRLKNLAKPFRIPSTSEDHHVFMEKPRRREEDLRTPSPSSSGICADIVEPCLNKEKRTSDVSSFSDRNSLEEDRRFPSSIGQWGGSRNESTRSSDEYSSPRRDWVIPETVEQDMRRNLEQPWMTIPTKVLPGNNIGEILEEELGSRKQIVCNKLSDVLKDIEHHLKIISKCTVAQNWRARYILQGTLASLREACSALLEAVELFLETTGRISIDRTNIKYVELNRLLAPLSEHRSVMTSLRKLLDNSGWTVAVLARERTDRLAGDPLDQFLSVARQVQPDCIRILQWTGSLIPSNSILFLSPSSTTSSITSPIRTTERTIPLLNMPEEKRNSTSSNSTIGGGTATSSESSPSSILVTSKAKMDKPQRGRVTFADQKRLSSDSSDCSLEDPKTEGRIMEEDDLESNVSDRDLFQDYAFLDDVVPGRSRLGDAIEEDNNLVKFYQPQFNEQTDALTSSVEEFLAAVESNQPPREFVQKGKLIILAAHKLIYIGDTVSQCLSEKAWADKLKNCADLVCSNLKDCVQAMKTAADEYPDICTMQEMVDSVMRVSATALELKSALRQR